MSSQGIVCEDLVRVALYGAVYLITYVSMSLREVERFQHSSSTLVMLYVTDRISVVCNNMGLSQ